MPLELGFSSSLTLVVLLARDWKKLGSYLYVDLQTLLQEHVMKIFSSNAFVLNFAACLQEKLVSCPDDLLFVERKRCSSMASILQS